MSHKTARIAALSQPFEGRGLDARYLGFFDCFNGQRFFEAHEVLEELWLPQRGGPSGAFYKGLIQLAGAFVHVQHGRPGPAQALLRLARANLEKFPPLHEGLDVAGVLKRIEHWMARLGGSAQCSGFFSSPGEEVQLPMPAGAAA